MANKLGDKKYERRGFLFLSVVFLCIAIFMIILGPIVGFTFATFSSIPITISLGCFLKVALHRYKSSTFWAFASISVGLLGTISIYLVNELNLISGSLIYYMTSAAFGLVSILVIISSGEVLRISGIVKIGLVILIWFLIGGYFGSRLNSMKKNSDNYTRIIQKEVITALEWSNLTLYCCD